MRSMLCQVSQVLTMLYTILEKLIFNTNQLQLCQFSTQDDLVSNSVKKSRHECLLYAGLWLDNSCSSQALDSSETYVIKLKSHKHNLYFCVSLLEYPLATPHNLFITVCLWAKGWDVGVCWLSPCVFVSHDHLIKGWLRKDVAHKDVQLFYKTMWNSSSSIRKQMFLSSGQTEDICNILICFLMKQKLLWKMCWALKLLFYCPSQKRAGRKKVFFFSCLCAHVSVSLYNSQKLLIDEQLPLTIKLILIPNLHYTCLVSALLRSDLLSKHATNIINECI